LVYADVLLRLADPLATLRRHRALLSPAGTVSCAVPNVQHHSVVRGLVRGVLPYDEGTLLDPAFRRLYTSAGVMQLLLDAGYAPDTVDRLEEDDDDGAPELAGAAPAADPAADTVVAGAALFEMLGVGAADAERDLRTTRLLVRGLPVPDVDDAGDGASGDDGPGDVAVTFVACVNDDEQLAANLARSPCLGGDGPHELLVFRGCASAAEGLNGGLARARGAFVVFVHQDVYIPEGWPARMVSQWRLAESGGSPIGIAGVFGVLDRTVPFDAIGRVVHRDRLLAHRTLPADVDGLDELLMVVPRDTALRVDPELGWHLYGTDLALQARQRGLRVVVLDAPCHHNSLTGRVPSHYRHSERVMARKWQKMLPIHTNLSSIDAWLLDEGRAAAQGDADTGADPDTDRDTAHTTTEDDGPPGAVAELVARLRREQVALNRELEQARLRVASMQASPFWRARTAYAAVRDRLRRRP
ncbi:MAG: glycosyltransferase, partial [Acidimicrobiales bacterium]